MENLSLLTLSEKNIYHFWLDHLEVYGTFHQEYLFEWLDFDNSNYIEHDDYILTKHEIPQYVYKIVFTKENFPVFAYYKGKQTDKGISTKDHLCIYATAFRMFWMKHIYKTLYAYINPQNIRRFDICIDILEPIQKVLDTIGEIRQKSAIFSGEKGETETLYIWEKQTTKNKRQLIRIYNKILDIQKKHKHTLYSDYLWKQYVTRIELEVRTELAKNANLDQVFSLEELMYIFKNYLQKHSKLFGSLSWNAISLYRERKALDYDIIQFGPQKRERAIIIFIGHAKTLLNKMGYCPVSILMEEWLMRDQTKIDIGHENLEEFRRKAQIKRKGYEENKSRYS